MMGSGVPDAESVEAELAVTIRPALRAEASALAQCHIRCWQEAYAGLLSAQYLDGLDAQLDARTRRWQSMITDGDPLVAVTADDEVVGFASAGAGDEDDVDVILELSAIYVRQSLWGTGLGQRLLDARVEARDAYLWVFADNARSCRFYARNGFVPDGKTLVEERFGLAEIRMVRRN